MKKNPTDCSLLGISPNEHTVFSELTSEPVSTAHLTRVTKLPRPSVDYALSTLLRRGLVRKARVGARTHWKRSSDHTIRKKLHSITSYLTSNNDDTLSSQEFVYIHTDADLTVVQGIGALMDTYMHAYSTEKSQRIQLTQYPEALRKQIASQRGNKFMLEANRIASNNRGITELLASQDTTALWKERISQKKTLSRHAAKRIIDAAIVPEEYVPGDLPAELFISGETAMLTDWETETGIIIHNKHIVRMLRTLFHAAKAHGEPFNPGTIFLKKLEDAEETN